MSVDGFWLAVVCCWFSCFVVVRCLLFAVRCLLFAVCCLLLCTFCLSFADCWCLLFFCFLYRLFVVFLFFVGCLLSVVWCWLFGVCCVFLGGALCAFVAGCGLFVVVLRGLMFGMLVFWLYDVMAGLMVDWFVGLQSVAGC